jgi:hypothetical protein
MIDRANHGGRSKFPGENYEAGVDDALRWILEGGPPPLEEAE